MDRIDLPLIKGDVPLSTVFDRMAETGTHAAVIDLAGKEPRLVTNHDVDEALERGLKRVTRLTGRPLRVFDAEVDDWEAALDAAAVSYGTVDWGGREAAEEDTDTMVLDMEVPADSMVTIVTRHETLAYDIRNSGEVCRCVKNNHRAPRGAPCPFCRSTVRCA